MKWLFVLFSVVIAGCSIGPTVPKGEATVQSRGSEALTNEGDPLLTSGLDARRGPC